MTAPAELPPPADRPAAALAQRTAVDGDGAYWRDADGVWRYREGGDEVPGATDLHLRDLFDPPVEERDGTAVRVVPRAWASRNPDHPLAWVFEHAELGTREPIVVPQDEWASHADEVVAMAAPDLHPHNLVGVDGVAALAGVSAATVRAYLTRRQMPAPTGRVGGSPVWPRAVIERWLRTRRARPVPIADESDERDVPPADDGQPGAGAGAGAGDGGGAGAEGVDGREADVADTGSAGGA